jgi:hypothetical protein
MARQMMDMALDSNEDIDIQNGDFTIAESTAQHQRQLIFNNKGDFKENPSICAGVFQYFDDERLQNLVRAVTVEFNRDGMDVTEVTLKPDGTINSVAVYR